jgi:glycosyltransferase involved in cell wall biosynthesis
MDITIIVIAYNEEKNIRDCLDALTVQIYSLGKLEIIVVDGLSKDKTPLIVEEYAQRYSFVKLINNPGKTISSNRNVGIQHARFPFVAFTDADCICPQNWLEKLASGYLQLKQTGVRIGAVGGGNTSDDQFGNVPAAIGVAFDTPISALGSQQTMIWKKVKEVESLAGLNVLYDKSIFDQVGMFDESQKNIAEDWIFNFHLREKGYRLFFLPNVTILHKMRTTLPGFLKQMFCYGLGRGALIRKNKKTVSLRYTLPLLFLLLMALSLPGFFYSGSMFCLMPLIYFPVLIIYSLFLCIVKKKVKLTLMVILIFLIIHFIYSLGEWIGLLKVRGN